MLLTPGRLSACSPRFLPDGSKLVFLSNEPAAQTMTHMGTAELLTFDWPGKHLAYQWMLSWASPFQHMHSSISNACKQHWLPPPSKTLSTCATLLSLDLIISRSQTFLYATAILARLGLIKIARKTKLLCVRLGRTALLAGSGR